MLREMSLASLPCCSLKIPGTAFKAVVVVSNYKINAFQAFENLFYVLTQGGGQQKLLKRKV
ncbi:hypothetical protein Tph_c13660 [Thermacetogenium phaeum DSM 12270]|uniref:Uncharacterized protein n=1 Tax=Thermacetogenium phaeum (strain ATCC BAA-254 / DSM 26808 / PB) TaxID=1089553 RepID=K4LHN7_THEPS|nr:hypothetical protein Tph_c13660 [Thermacetogenium phaeum DSM 12270]